jgi:periplasmic divalent cation tolerance protein
MQSAYAIVLTTTATEEQAAALARELVESGLAACVQIEAIRSIYRWNSQLHDEPEWRLSIKTLADRYAALEQFIRTHHTYETPEIMRLDIADGSPEYLRWIDESLK